MPASLHADDGFRRERNSCIFAPPRHFEPFSPPLITSRAAQDALPLYFQAISLAKYHACMASAIFASTEITPPHFGRRIFRPMSADDITLTHDGRFSRLIAADFRWLFVKGERISKHDARPARMRTLFDYKRDFFRHSLAFIYDTDGRAITKAFHMRRERREDAMARDDRRDFYRPISLPRHDDARESRAATREVFGER